MKEETKAKIVEVENEVFDNPLYIDVLIVLGVIILAVVLSISN